MGGGGGGGGGGGNRRQAGLSDAARGGLGYLSGGFSEVFIAGRNYVADREAEMQGMQEEMLKEQRRVRAEADAMNQRLEAEEKERTAQQGLMEERNRQRRRVKAGQGSQGRDGTILTAMGEGADKTALGDEAQSGKTLLGV